MARQTSIDAYDQIKDEGLLSDLRWKVYDHLYNHGPLTAKQITVALTCHDESSGVYNTRLSELKRLGVILEVDEGPCPISGRKVIHWDVTDALPSEPDKKMTSKQKIAFLRATLEIAVRTLRESGLESAAVAMEQNIEFIEDRQTS